MAAVRKTITLSKRPDAWIQAQITNGDFTNDSEYIRSLVARDQKDNEALEQLRAAMGEGLRSGVSSSSIQDIWREAEERIAKPNG